MINGFLSISMKEDSYKGDIYDILKIIKLNKLSDGVLLELNDDVHEHILLTIEYIKYLKINTLAIELNLSQVSKLHDILENIGEDLLSHIILVVDEVVNKDLLGGLANLVGVDNIFSRIKAKKILKFVTPIIEKDFSISKYTNIIDTYSPEDIILEYIFKETQNPKDSDIVHSIELLITYVKNDVLVDIVGLPPCIAPNYEENFRFKFRRKLDYSPIKEGNKFTEPMLDENYIKKNQCKLCKYDLVCQGMPKQIHRELPNILLQEEDYLCNIEEIDQNLLGQLRAQDTRLEPKVDTIVMMSGGLDSKLSAALYADKNPTKSVALLTFVHGGSINVTRPNRVSTQLMSKYKNIKCHHYITLPKELYMDIAFGKESLDFNHYHNSNVGCSICKSIMILVSAFVANNYYSAKTIVTGSNQVRANRCANPPFPQSKEMLNIYNKILEEHSLKFDNPLYNLTHRSEIINLARKYDIELSSNYSIICTLGYPQPMQYGINETIKYMNTKIQEIGKIVGNK